MSATDDDIDVIRDATALICAMATDDDDVIRTMSANMGNPAAVARLLAVAAGPDALGDLARLLASAEAAAAGG
jgi:hypothetical protein